MKTYHKYLTLYILLTIVTSIVIGIMLSYKLIWISLLLAILLVYIIFRFYRFLNRINFEVKRLIDAIRIGEFNISFAESETKGLDTEIKDVMQVAVQSFSKKINAVKVQQHFYDILLNRIDTPIILVDVHNRITWINKAALDIFEVKNPLTLDDINHTSPSLIETLEHLKAREVKTLKLLKENTNQTLAVSASLLTIQGECSKLINLKNIQQPLEEKENEAWKKLTRILTHEIMNSLTPIISLAEVFADSQVEHDYQMLCKAMQVIHRRSDGLVDFVKNYQKLAQLPQPQRTHFQIKPLLIDIQHLLQADNIQFSLDVSPKHLQLYADYNQMEQVLINLIKNAWEATSQDSHAQISVLVEFDSYQQTSTISISDNGHGISPSVLENVFLPFYTTKPTGSGVGLSICRQIINNHQGSLTLNSVENEGTKLVIIL